MPTFRGEALMTVMVETTVIAESEEEANRKARAIQINATAWEGAVANISYNAVDCTVSEEPEA